MTNFSQTVFIVDDDPAIAQSLSTLLASYHLRSRCFISADDFLQFIDPEHRGCLILDINMPGMNGLELQKNLVAKASNLPIIFLSGHADVHAAVQSLKSGAFEFLEKPYDSEALLECIIRALKINRNSSDKHLKSKAAEARMKSLTKRETEVLRLVVNGHQNKVIAAQLNLSQRTVEIYRSNVMTKMQTKSLAQLVRMVDDADMFASIPG